MFILPPRIFIPYAAIYKQYREKKSVCYKTLKVYDQNTDSWDHRDRDGQREQIQKCRETREWRTVIDRHAGR